MTDRELLKLTAKAAGIDVVEIRSGGLPWTIRKNGVSFTWSPLTDDAAALRLAAKLSIRIEPSPRGCSVMWRVPEGIRVETVLCSVIGADPNAATRRAIVRAAAEIGRSLP